MTGEGKVEPIEACPVCKSTFPPARCASLKSLLPSDAILIGTETRKDHTAPLKVSTSFSQLLGRHGAYVENRTLHAEPKHEIPPRETVRRRRLG